MYVPVLSIALFYCFIVQWYEVNMSEREIEWQTSHPLQVSMRALSMCRN